ncbi:MAG: response regulator [Caldilineaceae bacterium]
MEQSGQKGQILVVEDENIVALDIRQSLNRLGYGVPTVAATGEEAVAAAQQWQPDLVLMDIRLRGKMDGIEAATKIRRDQRLPIVYLTAFADARTLDRAKMTEPFGYVLKPFEDQELHSTIEMALHHHKMERRLQENERWLNTILRSIGDAVIATDAVGRISFMNAVAEKLTGCLSEESSGMLFEHVLQIFGHTAGRIQPVHVVQPQSDIESVRSCEDCTLVLPDKSSVPIDCTIAPLLEDGRLVGSVVVFRDISRRKRVESELRASEQRYRDLFEQAQTALLTSELHNQINRSLMASVNVHDVLQAIVDGVGQVITASHVFLHITERENGGLHPGVHNHSGQDRNSADYIDPDIYWPQLVEMVIQEKRPIHLRRPSSQPLENAHRPLGEGYLGLSAGNPFLEHPQGHNFAAVATVPLVYRGKVLGAMTAIGLRSDPPVTEREMELMMVIANQATVAIENARLFEDLSFAVGVKMKG